jgi:hypothetical protein
VDGQAITTRRPKTSPVSDIAAADTQLGAAKTHVNSYIIARPLD